MTNLLELAARVEALAGPCRETDCAVRIAVLGDVEFGTCWPFKPETLPMLSGYVAQFRDVLNADDAIPDDIVPRYTASLDAAKSLWPNEVPHLIPSDPRICTAMALRARAAMEAAR